MAALDQLTGLMSLIQGVQGGSQTTKASGATQTSQTQLSDAAVQEQIKRILAGSGGVRDVGGAARRSGLYNNTSEDLLLGNLYATAANQGEIARAPIVTTSAPRTETTTTPGAGLGTVAGALGGAVLLNSVLNSSAAKSFGNSALDFVGLGGSESGPTNFDSSGAVDFGVGGMLNGNPGFQIGGSIVDGNGAAGGWSGDSFNTQVGLGLPGTGGSTSGASGNYSKDSGDFDLLGSVGNAVSGFFSGGGLGGLVGAIQGGTGGGGGSGGGTTGGSIICTALMSRGLLDADHYAKGEAYIKQVPMDVKIGYYSWAASIAAKIRAGDKFWTKVCLPFAKGRTALLATDGSVLDHIKHPLGSLTKFVGEPVCGMIGRKILAKIPTQVN